MVLAGATLAWVGACSLFHGEFPDDERCKTSSDCFAFQGEVCYVATGECGPAPDAAPPRPDAPPKPDAPPVPDAGPDAAEDAAVADDGAMPDA
jgi:hypothetical protein